jgi:hypothetical protein
VVNWTGPLDVTADDLFGSCVPLRAGLWAQERAAEWLREFLSGGSRRAPEVESAARAAGIPDRTLRRVKATVGVVSAATSHEGKIEWWWHDPKADAAERAATRATIAEINAIGQTLMASRPRAARPNAPEG